MGTVESIVPQATRTFSVLAAICGPFPNYHLGSVSVISEAEPPRVVVRKGTREMVIPALARRPP
jgi:hypothetical protein